MLNELIEESKGYDSQKLDTVVVSNQISFDELARMLPDGRLAKMPPLKMTTWAQDQLFTKLGPAVFGRGSKKSLPRDYLGSIPSDLLATNLNRIIQGTRYSWLIRQYGYDCRAVLDGHYPCVDNTEILMALNDAISDRTDVHVARARVTPDSMNVQTIWHDGHKYGVGVYVGDGEIGNQRVRVLPLVKRTACDNSIIVDEEATSFTAFHKGSTRHIMFAVRSAIGQALKMAGEVLDRFMQAEYEKIESFDDVLNGLALRYKWDDDRKANLFLGTENNQSRMGLVNGVSYMAQSVGDEDERTGLEVLSGRLLYSPAAEFLAIARSYRRQSVER